MFFPLMLLETTHAPFDSTEFIFETKYDGVRAQYSNIDAPFLYTRNKNIINPRFPEVMEALSEKMVLDGELISVETFGKEDFEGIIKRLFMRKALKIMEAAQLNPSIYYVFDILYYKGEDLRNRELLERKVILDKVITDGPVIKKVLYQENCGKDLFNQIAANGLEGMVAKRKSSRYLGKRSWEWQKIINWLETEAIISGYTKKDNALLCLHSDGRPMCHVIHGMSPVQKEAFFKISKSIKLNEDSQYVYLQPIIRCRLKGRGFTSKGALRSGIFLDFIF